MKKLNLLLILFLVLSAVDVLADTLTIRPDGQGYYSAWTNSGCGSGTSEWQCVDEDPANTSDNLYTSAKNTYESFSFGATGLTTETINSVTLYFYGQRYSSTRYQFQPLIRASSTNYLGSLKSLTSSYASYSETYTTNPATGSAWTIAEVNALEAGMKSYSASYGGIIAQVYAVVDYSTPDSCSDSDSGNYPLVFGTTSGYLSGSPYSHDDSCVDSSNVLEYYCSGTSEQSSQQSCGTDGYVGSNYCLSGDVYRNYTDYSCASGECDSSTSPILQQDCVSGQYCSAGQCLWSDSCSDDDSGNYTFVFGTVSGYYDQSPYSDDDSCVDSSNILEYYCSGNYKQSYQQSCGTDGYVGSGFCYDEDVYQNYTDYSCASGACGSSTSPLFVQDCGTDGYTSSNFCYLGDVYKNYTDVSCGSGSCLADTTLELQQDCVSGQYCSAGQCLWSDSCTDTDGGNVITLFGTASGHYNQSSYSDDDYCVDTSNVFEYYCSGNYKQSSQQSCGTDGYVGGNFCYSGDVYRNYTDYSCASGQCGSNKTQILQQDCVTGQYCSGGVCYWSDSCTDTDGGLFALVLGNVTGYYYSYPYTYTDYCYSNVTLTEYYCAGSVRTSTNMTCITNETSVCSSGKCI